jgi:hypothetical protein
MFVDPDGREAQQCCGKLWELTKAYYSGLYQGAKATVQGTANFVRHPINSINAASKAMAKDPIGAQTNMLKSVAKTFSPMVSAASIGYTAATKGVNAAGREAGSDLTQKVIDATVTAGLKGAGNLIGKATAAGEASTSKSITVTQESVTQALQDSSLKTTQGVVSGPVVENYVGRIMNGDVAPPIKVTSEGVIVEGNHRYVAGKLTGVEPEQVPGTLSPSQQSRVAPVKDTKVDPTDWGQR